MAERNDGHEGDGAPAAPAGWYPVDRGMQRYWDGTIWTEHTAPAPDVAAPAPEAPAPWVDGAPAGQTAPNPGYAVPPEAAIPQPFSQQPGYASQGYGSPQGYGAAGVTGTAGPVTSDDRSMALLIHLLALVSGFIGPLIVWLVKRDESAFIDFHGKEALNFQITMFMAWIAAFFAAIVLIGFLVMPILIVLQVILPILAAVAANRGEYYRYPLTLRVIS